MLRMLLIISTFNPAKKMNATTYPGIDYSRGLSNCDGATGIRYGVIGQNSVGSDAMSEVYDNAKDLAWETALAEAIAEAKKSAVDPDDIDEDSIADELGMNWESSLGNMLYEQDGYKLTGCLDNDLFVLRSPFYTFAQFCSPCVPGAGNLDSPFESSKDQQSLDGVDYATEAVACGFAKCFCLGHDWFEDGMAPYAVYSVATGKYVSSAT